MVQIKPNTGIVALEPISEEKQSMPGNIEIETPGDKFMRMRVVAIGPGCTVAEFGDTALVPSRYVTSAYVMGKEFHLTREDNCPAFFKDSEAND